MLLGMTANNSPRPNFTPLQIVQVAECLASLVRGCHTIAAIGRHTGYAHIDIEWALADLERRRIVRRHPAGWWLLVRRIPWTSRLSIRGRRALRHVTGTADSTLMVRRARAAAQVDRLTQIHADRDAA